MKDINKRQEEKRHRNKSFLFLRRLKHCGNDIGFEVCGEDE
jgi:hypothetical protein